MNPLDSPVWHALTGPHAKVAEGGNHARRYRPEFTVWCALQPEPDRAAWDELSSIVGDGGVALLSGPPSDLHDWEIIRSFPILQMVLDEQVLTDAPADVVVLNRSHADAMAVLAHATEPGPWATRTHELGDFVGVFSADGHDLVAMAGERLRLPTATEISAVCTDPDHRGRGLAATLVSEIARGIQARGALPFLHVRAENAAAVRVYERLGFRTRIQTQVAVVHRPSGARTPPTPDQTPTDS